MSPRERVALMVGKTVKSVSLSPDREKLTFEMEGGSFDFAVEGDCFGQVALHDAQGAAEVLDLHAGDLADQPVAEPAGDFANP